jgi:hypothetical protein
MKRAISFLNEQLDAFSTHQRISAFEASLATRSRKKSSPTSSAEVKALSSVSTSDSARILIDSGASCNFINPKIPLSNFRKTTPVSVAMANGQTEQLDTSASLKGYPVIVSPSFNNSLFSVGDFCGDSSDKVFVFTNNESMGIHLTDQSAPIFRSLISSAKATKSVCIHGIKNVHSNLYEKKSESDCVYERLFL